jgi:hypothetical protein
MNEGPGETCDLFLESDDLMAEGKFSRGFARMTRIREIDSCRDEGDKRDDAYLKSASPLPSFFRIRGNKNSPPSEGGVAAASADGVVLSAPIREGFALNFPRSNGKNRLDNLSKEKGQ